jgi:hypothetical protein
MSLAWGSKFVEYSATGHGLDISPFVFRGPRSSRLAGGVQNFATLPTEAEPPGQSHGLEDEIRNGRRERKRAREFYPGRRISGCR